MTFCGEVERGPGRNRPDCGGDPDSVVDSGHSPAFFTVSRCVSVSYELDLMKFLEGWGVRPKDQSVRFWRRSGSVSGSTVIGFGSGRLMDF